MVVSVEAESSWQGQTFLCGLAQPFACWRAQGDLEGEDSGTGRPPGVDDRLTEGTVCGSLESCPLTLYVEGTWPTGKPACCFGKGVGLRALPMTSSVTLSEVMGLL